jgi:hypothetical protein
MNYKMFVFTAVLALCASAASAEMVWDAVADFDITQPANGVWTYGYGVGAQDYRGAFDLSWGDNIAGGGWTRSMGGSPDYSPYMFCNKTNDWSGAAPPHSMNLSSGEGGDDYHNYVRWTAPEAGLYQVDSVYTMMAAAAGGYWTGEMDVSTVVNGAVVFTDVVSGYDYQSLYSLWPPYSPGPKTHSGTYYLDAGSTVDFVGGIGWVNANSDFVNIDGCKVTVVPEPGTLVLLGCGFVGLLACIPRKRK